MIYFQYSIRMIAVLLECGESSLLLGAKIKVITAYELYDFCAQNEKAGSLFFFLPSHVKSPCSEITELCLPQPFFH
jgi:hypothetical protein